jgi:hypothetical protein
MTTKNVASLIACYLASSPAATAPRRAVGGTWVPAPAALPVGELVEPPVAAALDD